MPHFLPRSFDRCYHPAGWSYQMLAAIASGDRTAKLATLKMPPGQATAAAIPNAKLLIIDDMGHNLPRPRWGEIADAIAKLAGKKLAKRRN